MFLKIQGQSHMEEFGCIINPKALQGVNQLIHIYKTMVLLKLKNMQRIVLALFRKPHYKHVLLRSVTEIKMFSIHPAEILHSI